MRISLLIIILLAYGLRLYRLDAQSLWYDEGVTATIAQLDLIELTHWTANDIQPPLYYYLVALWGRLAGWSEWSLRFVSAFFGTLIIPLMAVVAKNLSKGVEKPSFLKKLAFSNLRSSTLISALLSTLFVALHPLLLYYSQEARMYTLLTALTVLAAYGLLRSKERFFLVLYTVAAVGAIYTHYFAFFLLLALAVAYLMEKWLEAREKTQNGTGLDADERVLEKPSFFKKLGFSSTYLSANLIIFVCYLPWFIWQLWRRRREQRRLLIYTIPWLIIPVGSILLLATFVPKFNARYAMLALPSLILLWGAGLSTSHQPPATSHQLPTTSNMFLSLLMLGGFVYADLNWFYDPAFTKDQWRELSSYVREQQAKNQNDDEIVVLVSGHVWPVWDYYAPDMPALHLPDIDILDVDAVVDLEESAQALRATLMDKAGVWLVGWQDEIVDPMNSVVTQLELSGWEKSVRPKFWGPTLHHFIWLDVDALQTASVSQGETEMSADFGHQITLYNHAITNTGDLIFFWQVSEDANLEESDFQIIVRSFTQGGRLPLGETAQQRLAGYTYPSYRWQPGEIVMSRISAEEWSGGGTLPDKYQIRVGVYQDQQPLTLFEPDGTPQGQEARLKR